MLKFFYASGFNEKTLFTILCKKSLTDKLTLKHEQ